MRNKKKNFILKQLERKKRLNKLSKQLKSNIIKRKKQKLDNIEK